ncbi:hypothetical protein FH972_017337 [Carpinus fangiana]|uniref:Uncharacterized protein n=1 Tax=Carpinus fangiana TaxID=176857 RepID=A0A5N6RLL7_9ROSI|nr:hypothetical protein FH972_017337 [Carpinus fangiana]
MWSLGRSFDEPTGLNLCLTLSFLAKASAYKLEIRRPGTPSMNSKESVTTTCFESGLADQHGKGGDPKLLTLFF